MKKLNLLEEVHRITNLLESVVSPWVKLGKSLSSIYPQSTDLGKRFATDLSNLAKVKTDEEALKILVKLSNSEKAFSDAIIPIVYKNIPIGVENEILEIIDSAKKQLQGKTPQDTVNVMIAKRLSAIKTEFNDINRLLAQDVQKQIPGFDPRKLQDYLKSKGVQETVSALEGLLGEWKKISGNKWLSPQDWLLLNDFPLRSFRANIDYILKGFYNTSKGRREKSLQKIVELLKRASNEYDAYKENPLVYRTIDAEVQALRQDENDVIKLFYDELENALSQTLKDGKKARDLRNNLEQFSGVSKDRQKWRDYLINDTYIGRMLDYPNTGNKLKDFALWFWNAFERISMWLTTGSLRKVDEYVQSFFRTYGPVLGSVYLYLYFQFVSKISLPFFWAIFDTLYYGFTRSTPAEEQDGEGWRLFVSNYEDNIKKSFLSFEEKFDESVQKNIPTDEIDVWESAKKSFIPFSWYWDYVLNGWDYVSAGMVQEERRRQMEEVQQRLEESGMTNPVPGGTQNRTLDTTVRIPTDIRGISPDQNTSVVTNTSLDD
jgi:hypothetical protein